MKVDWKKVIEVAKRFGAFFACFILAASYVVGTIAWQGICWSEKTHPGEKWWSLAIISIIICGFAAVPTYKTCKALARIFLDR